MERNDRRISPSPGELLDRLAIDQFKQLRRPESHSSIAEEIARIEADLDRIFTDAGKPVDAELIRLAIALAQVNVHIWHAKEVMQGTPARFKECMKLAHQLNGYRNQLKNAVSGRLGAGASPRPSNTSAEDLQGWRFSVLEGKGGG